MSSVAFTFMIIIVLATAFYFIIGPMQGHDTWVDELCRNSRNFYHYDVCNHPDMVAVAAGFAICLWIAVRMYRV
jgi:hypothetical protein